jgi:hypothetical protein
MITNRIVRLAGMIVLLLAVVPPAFSQNSAGSVDTTAATLQPYSDVHTQETDDASGNAGATSTASGNGAKSTDRLSVWGTPVPGGLRVNASTEVLAIYDTNPNLSPQTAPSDVVSSFTGLMDVTDFTGRTQFEASYLPQYLMYRRFGELNSMRHTFHGLMTHDVSKFTRMDWTVNVRKYPIWDGSLASVEFGSFLSALNGSPAQDLTSSVTNASTTLKVRHSLDARSHIEVVLDGALSKFSQSTNSLFIPGMPPPNSNTWSGGGSVAYDYDLTPRRSIGASVADTYFAFSPEISHEHYQYAHFRYQETFASGFTVDAGIGPGIREIQLSRRTEPGVDLSIGVNRKTPHSMLTARVTRTYEVGLVQGNLTTWYGVVAAQRQVGRHWLAGLYGNYTGSTYPTTALTANREVFTIGSQVGYRFGRQLTWLVNYGYSAQQGQVYEVGRVVKQQVASGFALDLDNLFTY